MSAAVRCCWCKCRRPEPLRTALKEGWHGAMVRRKGQRAHWTCPLHHEFFKDIVRHAELVAAGRERCEVT